jgi:hypothetical protein
MATLPHVVPGQWGWNGPAAVVLYTPLPPFLRRGLTMPQFNCWMRFGFRNNSWRVVYICHAPTRCDAEIEFVEKWLADNLLLCLDGETDGAYLILEAGIVPVVSRREQVTL